MTPALETGDPAMPARPVLTYRRVWMTLGIAAFALAAGLVAGIGLTSRLNKTSELNSPVPAIIAPPAQQVQAAQAVLHPAASPEEAATAPKSVRNHASKDAVPNRNTQVVERNPGHSITIMQAEEISIAADAASQAPTLLAPQPVSSDLPLRSPDMLSTLDIPEAPVAWNPDSTSSGDSIRDAQGPGAVRQAMDLAARKTGSFISRAGTSIKRAF